MVDDKKKPKGVRGVAYLRISSDKQDIASQRESIQRWLDEHGLTVGQWYTDVGSRDLAYKREDFQRLLKAVEAGTVDWVVVDTKDRFGTKNGYEFGRFACFLQDSDCELWSVTQGCLTADDPTTEILAAVDSVRSRDEQKTRSQRSLRGKITGVKRGEWQGGYCPFGFDVANFGPDGRERWRVYYTGAYERLKLYPKEDGRPPERYDGEGNFPAKDKGDVLRLVPSHDAKRVEVVRRIFAWFATESITIRGLCTRLNDLAVPPVFGAAWYASRLGPMLRNPAYVEGATVWNKKAHGRFYEFVEGHYQEVRRHKGRAPTGRKRAATDFVRPEGQHQGLIDEATWERVQAKLQGKRPTAKAPRNADLWLAGLLYCGVCGRRMSAWFQKNEKTAPRSYCCSAYRQFGRHNPHGCQLHRVKAQVVEALLDRYLAETGQRLDTLVRLDGEDQLLQALESETDRKQLDFLKTVHALWREVRQAGAAPPAGQPWTCENLAEGYRAAGGGHRQELAAHLAEKEAELDAAVKQFPKLTGKLAQQRANELMEALERDIEALRGRLQPLDQTLNRQRAELLRLERTFAEARETLAGDSNRRKAEAVGRVLLRIVCRFRYAQAGTQTRSILSEVVFEPWAGEPQTVTLAADLPNGSQRGPGC